MNNFWYTCMKILWIFGGGHHKIGLFFFFFFFFFWGGGSFLCILGSFLEVNVQNGDIILGCYINYLYGHACYS